MPKEEIIDHLKGVIPKPDIDTSQFTNAVGVSLKETASAMGSFIKELFKQIAKKRK